MTSSVEMSLTEKSLETLVEKLASTLAFAGRGEIASLRRLNIEEPFSPEFWKYVVSYISPDRPLTAEEEKSWAAIISGMAKMVPFHHRKGRSLGKVLAENDFSEQRLLKLLRLQGQHLRAGIRRLAIFLSFRAEPFDWTTIAALLLTQDSEKNEEIRRRIARDYFLTQKQKEAKNG